MNNPSAPLRIGILLLPAGEAGIQRIEVKEYIKEKIEEGSGGLLTGKIMDVGALLEIKLSNYY